MPEPSEAFELVRRDVEEGLSAWLVPSDDIEGAGFNLLEPFGRAGIWDPETGIAAVPWVYRGRHEGDPMGIQPTGRVIAVTGVTLVQETEAGLQFSRFVDWVAALGEMGVGLFSRPVTDLVPEGFG